MNLPTISKSAAEFTSKETRPDVLTNNAGVMVPPADSTTAQGFESQMGTNCLSPFLFTLFASCPEEDCPDDSAGECESHVGEAFRR